MVIVSLSPRLKRMKIKTFTSVYLFINTVSMKTVYIIIINLIHQLLYPHFILYLFSRNDPLEIPK